jgi:hypothetical protein
MVEFLFFYPDKISILIAKIKSLFKNSVHSLLASHLNYNTES